MDIKDVENLAELARIDLADSEKKEILMDLENILGYIKQIEQVSVTDTEQDVVFNNVWRDDVEKPMEFSRSLLVDQFPNSHDGFLKVKKIL